jgi:hypothetical protein
MVTSNNYNFNLSNSEIILEAFDNCEIRPTAITGQHMISARRSLNLQLQTMSNLGINLWAVDLQTIPLIQGVATYNIPTNTVDILDAYIRTYQLSNAFNTTVSFSTTNSSTNVSIAVANNGLQIGQWVNIVTPVSVGGIVLSGFYQTTSVLTNSFTITAANAATSTVVNGGVVPYFTTATNSANVTVTLNNHGYVAGQAFIVNISTSVAGITLLGSYNIISVTTNTFVITAGNNANSVASVYENSGKLNISTQSSVDPIDTILQPVGRTDYAAFPDKLIQSKPTIYWFDRLINPTITLYQVPDNTLPYTLRYYRMRQIQDSDATLTQNSEVPIRYLDALIWGLSVRLAAKYNKKLLPDLTPIASSAMESAQMEDREKVELQITPELASYYRI